MIAMRMTRTYDDTHRDGIAPDRACPAPDHPLRHAMMHALAMFGLGVGGMAADSEDIAGIG